MAQPLMQSSWPTFAPDIAAKLERLDQAKDDLGEILDFIAKESPRAAADYVTDLVTA